MAETPEEKAAREQREAAERQEREKNKSKPPWGSDDEFDPERAWKLITDLRDELKQVKKNRDELQTQVQEHEDAGKDEKTRLEERATTAEERASTAEAQALRLEVALAKAPEGLDLARVRQLAKRLTGSSKEELETDADELFADFAPPEGGSGGGGGKARPRETLRPGAVPSSEPEENDPRKLAEAVGENY